jgi:hypothetical protein
LTAAEAQVQLNQIARLASTLTNNLTSAIENADFSSATDILGEMNRLERYVSRASSRRRKTLRELLRLHALNGS